MIDEADRVFVGRAGQGSITFVQPDVTTASSGYLRVPILLEAPGLSAESAIELEGWRGWTTGLVAFFEAMAAEWRGWDGVKEWSDDGDYRTEKIAATHDGLGTVELRISTSRKISRTDDTSQWTLESVVLVDAGALGAAAMALRKLLGRPATS